MDEEKKKKKNKKKKGRQTKVAEDVSDGVGATTSLEHNHVDSIEQNHCNQVSGTVNVQMPGVVETNVSLDRHNDDGVKIASLDEKIRQLQSENDSIIQRKAGLDEEIRQLQSENDSFIQREAGLEKKIINLQNEKDSWLQKEVSLEEKIKQLLDEKDSCILKANSMNEMIGRLNEESMRLQTQVKELEEYRVSLVQEKQHLVETISSLQLQLQNLERETSFSASSTIDMTKHVSEREDLNAQIEAGRVLADKLIAENTQLVEKVNELYIELDRQSVRAAHSSTGGFDPAVMLGTATTAENVSESSEKMSASGERMESFETIQMGDRISTTNNADTGISAITTIQIDEYPASYEAGGGSEEIVQVPLDDSEVQENEIPVAALEAEENVTLPLSDAPLIGAPFRLFSFVAKYVSGADLVNKNTTNSSR
ncbi:centrosome-associated protein CEP250 [Macadamia integrifolia]|uniref:centrosome-associated protein CEP250 n=1 Tax=Macadamia integrifolia TaxID=60698 RepID=UPI001C528E7E|nr:centrosome-associated protein CEP250 [Macadamia integrifolia]XP_042476397.1 centrosome-associated protein CEP250 [Macadamia integrifolia]